MYLSIIFYQPFLLLQMQLLVISHLCVMSLTFQPPPPKPSPTKMHKSPSGASVGSGPPPSTAEVRVSPVADSIPAESVQLFKKECIEVLSSIPDRKVLLSKFPEAYYKCKGQIFALSRYKAKKIVLLVQAIPDVMRV